MTACLFSPVDEFETLVRRDVRSQGADHSRGRSSPKVTCQKGNALCRALPPFFVTPPCAGVGSPIVFVETAPALKHPRQGDLWHSCRVKYANSI